MSCHPRHNYMHVVPITNFVNEDKHHPSVLGHLINYNILGQLINQN
jgi:hypothetical protein